MTSPKSYEKLAVDANAILSAITGGSTRRVFEAKLGIAFVTTRTVINEVKSNLDELAEAYELPSEYVEGMLENLPLEIYDDHQTLSHLAEAARMLRGRRSNDVSLLALALKLEIPIWSNDKHFENLPVRVIPSARLLKRLRV